MSEVPHCPECARADTVDVRKGPEYEYYCRRCARVIKPDDVTDAAWVDMVSEMMFNDPQGVKERSEHNYSTNCECSWCERGRPGMDAINLSA